MTYLGMEQFEKNIKKTWFRNKKLDFEYLPTRN